MTAMRLPIAHRVDERTFLGSRQAVALYFDRHPDQVKRHCEPVACDLKTRTPLYDSAQAARVLRSLRRRVA